MPTLLPISGAPISHFMLTKKTIGFLGAGVMAEALVKGLTSSGAVSAGQLLASDKSTKRLAHMAEVYEIKVLSKNYEVVSGADIIVVAVKPQDMAGLLGEIAQDLSGDKLIISIAAGVTTAAIKEAIKKSVPVVRVMPNTATIVGEGAIGIFAAQGVSEGDIKLACAIFSAVGKVVAVDDESLMDAVTGLSGSGPAYVFLFMEALARAGVKAGLSKEDALLLAMQTTLGAARLAIESDKTLKELREMVTSPKGTTFEGLKKLEEGGFTETIGSAVEAATKRSRELS